jgi:HJR/Mrr/RecB family endonuclease
MVASKGASIQEVETFLKEHGVTASVRKSSDTGSELLVECDGANTEQV